MIWLPIAVIVGGSIAAWRHSKRRGMTPERKKVYEAALKTLKDPGKLRSLADTFEKEGLVEEAVLLRKRAALRELPPDVKAKRKEAYRKGMASKDPVAILKLANEFEKQGATGAAESLREYAAGLKAA